VSLAWASGGVNLRPHTKTAWVFCANYRDKIPKFVLSSLAMQYNSGFYFYAYYFYGFRDGNAVACV